MEYKNSNDVESLRKALPDFEKSVEAYQELTNLTKDTYLYANSMQTKQRKIPMRGVDATFKHWTDMLPVFETELGNFKKSVDSLSTASGSTKKTYTLLSDHEVEIKSKAKFVKLRKGANLYLDQELVVTHLAKELEGLNALMIQSEQQNCRGLL